jgi:hypothetical protein
MLVFGDKASFSCILSALTQTMHNLRVFLLLQVVCSLLSLSASANIPPAGRARHASFGQRCLSSSTAALVVVNSLFITPLSVHAQIPTMDEYNTGSGTRVKAVGVSAASTTVYTPLINPDLDEGEVTMPLMIKAVEKAKSLAAGNYWDNVILELKSFTSADKDKNSNNKKSEVAVKQLLMKEPAKYEELKFIIGQVVDTARASRVVFFNQEDKKQVQGMVEVSASDVEDDRAEVTSLLEEALKILKEDY